MPGDVVDDLLPAEWAALGVVASGPTHGYDVARALGEDGVLGHVWTVPRPLVYRALQQLEHAGLVEAVGEEASARGPRRTTLRVTRRGRARLKRWLGEPVERPRDVRSMLMLKLALLHERGDDLRPLLAAQREVMDRRVRELRAERRASGGFDRTLLAWRLEYALGVVRFLAAAQSEAAETPDDGR